jgi:hypothetical protein
MLTANNIKELCDKGELSLVDYKLKQYDLEGDDREKSKFVKDILAFANTHSTRNDRGYILIGVEEDTSLHIGMIKGADRVLDSNVFRQLADSKINRKVPFEVYPIKVDGSVVQVIEIPTLTNISPYYAEKEFGIIKRNTVYFRLNGATVEAKPEDVWEMGRVAVLERTPELSMGLIPVTGILDDGFVHAFNLNCDIDPSYGIHSDAFGLSRLSFGESEWAVYKWYQKELSKLRFHVSLRNMSEIQADNVKVKLSIVNPDCGARIVEATDWENVPSTKCFRTRKGNPPKISQEKNLCPGEECGAFEIFYVLVKDSCDLRVRVDVFGRNIQPQMYEHAFVVKKHDVTVEISDLHEIESNVEDMSSYSRLLTHFLCGIKKAADAGRDEPDWNAVMTCYRRSEWNRREKELGYEKD